MNDGELTRNDIEDLVKRLGGKKGVKSFLSGEMTDNEARHGLGLWKKVRIGNPNLKTLNDFRRAFGDLGMKLSKDVDALLENHPFAISTQETEVDLVAPTLKSLGFSQDPVWYKQICPKVEQLKLEMCTIEIVLQLRLQYEDQPLRDHFLVGMEPIVILNRSNISRSNIFEIKHSTVGLSINSMEFGKLLRFWRESVLVLVRPRK